MDERAAVPPMSLCLIDLKIEAITVRDPGSIEAATAV